MPDATTIVPRPLEKAAAYSWRLIVIGAVVVAGLWLLQRAAIVVIPIVIALFLTRILSPVSGWLCRHRWRPGVAAVASLLVFLIVIGSLLTVVVRSVAAEAESIGPTLTEAADEIEDWLVDDSPFEVSRASIDRIRDDAAVEFDSLLQSSDGSIKDRATLVAELFAGSVLALILTFFLLRDGRRLAEWSVRRARSGRRSQLRRSLDAAWSALAGYLRGASLLGVVEAVAIGITLWLVGADLIAPMMVLTFLGAFVPLVGAVLAGVIAVMVALVTAGTSAALIVAVVALVVQQLDNDLLAPVIYGRALRLHPAVVLLSVVGGGALFGLAGTVLAVPIVAVASHAIRAYREGDPQTPAATEA